MRTLSTLIIALISVFFVSEGFGMRIKDMASIKGVRSNQLLGYGLVIGLDGTGDQTSQTFFTGQSMKNMLEQMGIVVPDSVNLQVKNVAAVMVQAELPPFAKPGQTIDVTVSSIGNAKSLRAGALVMTQLKGVDGRVYAVAQGNLIVGGFSAEGGNGSSVTVNSTTGGRIPNGATVERAVPTPLATATSIQLNLHDADFTTAKRVADTINGYLGSQFATAKDSVSIDVDMPLTIDAKIALISEIENIEVEPAEAVARVIVNSRTGTVVIGNRVTVLPAAVSHGNLTVSVAESSDVSQPGAFSDGETVITQESAVTIQEDSIPMFMIGPSVTLKDLVDAVNGVGASPGDLVSILQALEEVGALRAQLVVI